MNRIGLIASSLLVLLALAASTLFVVDQRQFGVVYALGSFCLGCVMPTSANFEKTYPKESCRP